MRDLLAQILRKKITQTRWRRWTGIEPASQGSPATAALKAVEPTRCPDTSGRQGTGWNVLANVDRNVRHRVVLYRHLLGRRWRPRRRRRPDRGGRATPWRRAGDGDGSRAHHRGLLLLRRVPHAHAVVPRGVHERAWTRLAAHELCRH